MKNSLKKAEVTLLLLLVVLDICTTKIKGVEDEEKYKKGDEKCFW